MTMPRRSLVDPNVTLYYHCISRCVRRAYLCGKGAAHRKAWIESRLRELACVFAVDVCAYAILDNHIHVVVRIDPYTAASWTAEDVIQRWVSLFPPKLANRKAMEITPEWIAEQAADAGLVAKLRERLCSLSWFMKCLKEPLARMANREDDCRGTFWEARFKSIAILDLEALLSTMVYVDLNIVAAGLAPTPESSPHTSVSARVADCRQKGLLPAVTEQPEDRSRHITPQEDETFWLQPIEDRRERGGQRPGITSLMNLTGYLRLLDWSSRQKRDGKRTVPDDVADILIRLDSSSSLWRHRLDKLLNSVSLYGVVFATQEASVREFAVSRGVSKLINLNGCQC